MIGRMLKFIFTDTDVHLIAYRNATPISRGGASKHQDKLSEDKPERRKNQEKPTRHQNILTIQINGTNFADTLKSVQKRIALKSVVHVSVDMTHFF